MKFAFIFLTLLFSVSCGFGKERSFTGSTPADAGIRSFLDIPQSDSIDFIRWKLSFSDLEYHLHCIYGIGKPNTNGFINGGKTIKLDGLITKDKNYYQLKHGNKTLQIVELNGNLLHLLKADKTLIVGNAGWSYTLNIISPFASDELSIRAPTSVLGDSMVFEGRTPCGMPGIIEKGRECYKLKWLVVLYANARKNEPGTYKILGTPWRKQGGRTGTWEIVVGNDGRIIYQLNDEKEKGFLFLVKPDDNILLFTTADGKLLVGDEDFSYTLNRRRSPFHH